MDTTSLRRLFLCRILRRHHWQIHTTDDGGRYSRCTVCSRDNDGILGRPNLLRGW